MPNALTLALYTDHLRRVLSEAERLLAASSPAFDALVLPWGNAPSKCRYDDQDFPFRAGPHAEHFLPLGEPGAVLVVAPGKRPTLFRRAQTSFWERPAPFSLGQDAGPDGAALAEAMLDCFDHEYFETEGALADAVVARAGQRAAIVGDEPALSERFPFEHRDPKGLIDALHEGRTTKTPWEIAALSLAGARAARGHRAVAEAFFAGGKSELELHLVYLAATALDDSETPYKNIVALGPNAAVLHHVAYGRTLPQVANGRALLVDAGAPFAGYGSDITRCWVRADPHGPGRAWAALLGSMDKMQLALIDAAKVGLDYEALHDESHVLLAKVLVDHGLARGATSQLVERGVTRAFFPHGLGHHLGLQTHDVAGKPRAPRAENRFLRTTRSIEDGQVFTIEPGLYFIDALLEPLRNDDRCELVDWVEVDRLAPFGGIRIEDNIAMVSGKPKNLTRPHISQGDGTAIWGD